MMRIRVQFYQYIKRHCGDVIQIPEELNRCHWPLESVRGWGRGCGSYVEQVCYIERSDMVNFGNSGV